ncbi:MAG: type II secretion system F family protein [Planctomycetes bacterium]|nr:type II secretion system F family protein [Planctomycetota bacterium]
MAEFRYEAKDSSGKRQEGVLSAGSADEAASDLSKRGLTVVAVTPVSGGGARGKQEVNAIQAFLTGKVTAKSARVKLKELVIFTRQLATMISAGIPLLECLEILAEQVENPGFKAVLEEIVLDVRSGTDLSSALAKHPRVFEDIYVNMVRAGEVSGQIDEILVRLAEYQEATQKLRQQIVSAMTYPVISLLLIFGIVLFLLLVIIPKFKEIFASMGVELPWITQALLTTSDFLIDQWYIWVPGIIGGAIGLRLYSKTTIGRRQADWLKLFMPIFGPLFKKVSISRFTRTFATLISSGVPILGALEIVASTSGNVHIEELVMAASDSVRQGDTLASPLATRPKLFPPMVTRMIAIGEKSGALEQLLMKISEFYDDEVEAAVEQLTSLIEPLMICIMGVLVGGMVLAIFLPIFALQKALQS